MGPTDWYKHPQYIQDKKTILSEGEATYSLREAFKNVFVHYPSDKSLAILFAHTALETAHFKSIHFWNYGNVKKIHQPDDGYKFTMYPAGELENGHYVPYNPPDTKCHFRAYKSAIDGAEAYIRFLTKKPTHPGSIGDYTKAWQKILEGDPKAYSHELKIASYYSAKEEDYTPTVISLFNGFLRKKDELLSWKPAETSAKLPADPAPISPEPSIDSQRSRLDNSIPPLPMAVPDAHARANFIVLALMAIAAAFATLFSNCQHYSPW
jgi:hypothetical protein